MARAYKDECSKARFKDAAAHEFLLSARSTCGANDQPFMGDQGQKKSV
jgi:hypothetical protein